MKYNKKSIEHVQKYLDEQIFNVKMVMNTIVFELYYQNFFENIVP